MSVSHGIGPGKHIAPDHDKVDLGVTNVLEHGLQRGEVAVDVVDRGDSRDKNVLSLGG